MVREGVGKYVGAEYASCFYTGVRLHEIQCLNVVETKVIS